MPLEHLVQVGAFGNIGRFSAVDAVRYPRETRVICRTARGLEVGRVLDDSARGTGTPDGELLRRMTVEDELLLSRIEKHKDSAFLACCRLLAERKVSATLMDVEATFDGKSLYFYFLGGSTPLLENLTADLAAVYESEAKIGTFAETLVTGCGPDCGTDAAASGCGTGGCSTCAAVGMCHPK